MCIFTDLSKNRKMNFSEFIIGGTPSALLTWLKNYYIIGLKIELLAINVNITNDSRHFRFLFGPVNNKLFDSNLPV